MPNIAGREFAYTPQGMAAAEQYKQSLGMRGGGMMGFRPVGYADGDLVESETEIVLDPQSRAAYIERIMAARGMNDESIFMNLSDADIYNAYLAVEAAPSQGMGAPQDTDYNWFEKLVLGRGPSAAEKVPYGGLPTDKTHWRRSLQETMPFSPPKEMPAPEQLEDRRPYSPPQELVNEELYRLLGSGVTESPGFEPETGGYFPPQMAHGGYVGRGTSAGELAPRGSMSVREAGETMYELAKRRRGMRGGGIMSLRR
jgi:hypothetical protein